MIVEDRGLPGDFVKILDFGLAKLRVAGRGQARRHRRGHRHRHAGLHVARAGGGRAVGSAQRHLLHRRAAVSPRHRIEGVRGRRRALGAAAPSRGDAEVAARGQAGAGISERARGRARAGDAARSRQALPDGEGDGRGTVGDARGQAKHGGGELPSESSSDSSPRPSINAPGGGDTTRVDGRRKRERKGSSGGAWLFAGLLVGAVGAVAAVAYSPLGDLVRPHEPVRVTAVPPAKAPPIKAEAKRPHRRSRYRRWPRWLHPRCRPRHGQHGSSRPRADRRRGRTVDAGAKDAVAKDAAAKDTKDAGTAVANSDDDDDDDTPAEGR